jgi:radical SAM superfamily enzyme YgiQ (UPF0313 family)
MDVTLESENLNPAGGVLLINPNTEETSSPHLGLAYIAAFLQSKGVMVKIFDRTYSDWDTLETELDRMRPAFAGITCNTLLTAQALKAASIVKAHDRRTRVIMGGTQPTIMPGELLKERNVDIAVIGEGELTLHEIVGGKDLREVHGIAFRGPDGEILFTPPRAYVNDLDSLPFPARGLIPMDSYLNTRMGRTAWALSRPATTVMCSRGCPFHCSFCSSHLIFGRKVRYRSPENVIQELQELKRGYGIRGVQFHDDTMTLNRAWLNRLCDLMIENRLGLEWFCNARVGTVDLELLRKIERAGCTTITFGVESGSQRVLDRIIKKGITIEAIRDTFKLVRKTGLILHSTFMLGSPGETREEIERTIAFARELNPDVAHFAITIPFPGTEMFKMANEYGRLTFNSWNDFHFFRSAVFESSEFDIPYVKRTLKRAYRSYYFSPRYLCRQIIVTRSYPQLKRKLKGLRLLRNVFQS